MHRRMIDESLELQTYRHRIDEANAWRTWELDETQQWHGRVKQEMNNATAHYEAEYAALIISNQKLDTATRKYAEMTAQSISVNQDLQNLRKAHLQEMQLVQRMRENHERNRDLFESVVNEEGGATVEVEALRRSHASAYSNLNDRWRTEYNELIRRSKEVVHAIRAAPPPVQISQTSLI